MADERRYYRYYTIEEAARALSVTPARIREMVATGELGSLPPGATEQGVWKVWLPAEQSPDQPPSEQAQGAPDVPDEPPEIDQASAHVRTTAENAGQDAGQPGGEQPADTRQTAAETVSESGWATTEVAAEALGVSPRTVRDYIAHGKLNAKPEGEGVERRWLVSIDSVHTMRQARQSAGRPPRDRHEIPRGGEPVAGMAADLLMRVQDLQYRLGRAEARAELTERAQSSIREERDRLIADLERERQRADEERERAERLEAALEALREPLRTTETPTAVGRGNNEAVVDAQKAPQPPDSPGPMSTPTQDAGAQESGTGRAWWRRRLRRMLGG